MFVISCYHKLSNMNVCYIYYFIWDSVVFFSNYLHVDIHILLHLFIYVDLQVRSLFFVTCLTWLLNPPLMWQKCLKFVDNLLNFLRLIISTNFLFPQWFFCTFCERCDLLNFYTFNLGWSYLVHLTHLPYIVILDSYESSPLLGQKRQKASYLKHLQKETIWSHYIFHQISDVPSSYMWN